VPVPGNSLASYPTACPCSTEACGRKLRPMECSCLCIAEASPAGPIPTFYPMGSAPERGRQRHTFLGNVEGRCDTKRVKIPSRGFVAKSGSFNLGWRGEFSTW